MRALLVVHAVVGIALVGALTHHAVWALRARPDRFAQTRRYARLAAILAVVQAALGLWILPAWRPHTAMFQYKLWGAAVVLALALAGLVVRERGRGPISVGAAAVAWFVALTGIAIVGR